jgi:hypothetical protein
MSLSIVHSVPRGPRSQLRIDPDAMGGGELENWG